MEPSEIQVITIHNLGIIDQILLTGLSIILITLKFQAKYLMSTWKANVASEANAENLLTKVVGKRGAAELVEKINNRLEKRGNSIGEESPVIKKVGSAKILNSYFSILQIQKLISIHKIPKIGVQTMSMAQTINAAAQATRIACYLAH